MDRIVVDENVAPATPNTLTMRAIEYDGYGDASVLHSAQHPVPQLLPGQIMIGVPDVDIDSE